MWIEIYAAPPAGGSGPIWVNMAVIEYIYTDGSGNTVLQGVFGTNISYLIPASSPGFQTPAQVVASIPKVPVSINGTFTS
jgi:hypothetical protein